MTDDCFQPLPPVDPLGEVLHMLRLSGTLYCQATLTAPWGIAMPRLNDSLIFVIAIEGSAWVTLDGESAEIRQGSMVLLPHGADFDLTSAPGEATTPLFDLPVDRISDRYELMRHGGGGAVSRALAGVVQFDAVAAKRLVSTLPRLLHIDAWTPSVGAWVDSTLGLIAHEAATLRPGGETVMTRLADILVIQAIRAWLDAAPSSQTGWLAALRDPQIGRALVAIHRRPQLDWSLVALAREAGMSRSSFSSRFTELIGQSAMRYLAQWRLHVARASLLESRDPVGQIASRAGYQSEAAFVRAFRQFFGHPPGATRRLATAA